MVRITNTPLANEDEPIAIDERYFGFLSDANGIINRHVAYIDTVFAYNERVYMLKGADKEIILHADSTLNIPKESVDTTFIRSVFKPKGFSYANSNYERSVIEQHSAPRIGKVLQLVQQNNEYTFVLEDLDVNYKASITPTAYMKRVEKVYEDNIRKKQEAEKANELLKQTLNPKTENPFRKEEVKIDSIVPKKEIVTTKPPKDTGKIDIDNYFFQSEFEDVETAKPDVVVVDTDGGKTVVKPAAVAIPKILKEPEIHEFRRSRIIPYQLNSVLISFTRHWIIVYFLTVGFRLQVRMIFIPILHLGFY
ncbi:MAG: hypothetical protein HC803_02510 [Saprospiraceae bacterium]|nr:hypothetical protein [Saprospiraceae bacterium]